MTAERRRHHQPISTALSCAGPAADAAIVDRRKLRRQRLARPDQESRQTRRLTRINLARSVNAQAAVNAFSKQYRKLNQRQNIGIGSVNSKYFTITAQENK